MTAVLLTFVYAYILTLTDSSYVTCLLAHFNGTSLLLLDDQLVVLADKVPMFERCDDVFINQLVHVLRPQVLQLAEAGSL